MVLSELEGSLEEPLPLEKGLRELWSGQLAVVGVGNELRGDDYAGSYVAKRLMRRFRNRLQGLHIYDAESSPDSTIGKVSASGADVVVFVDSALMGSRPGTIRLVDVRETHYPYFSTHNIPLRLLSSMMEGVEQSFLLGIEPKSTEFGEEMSSEVRLACESVVDAISQVAADKMVVDK